MRKILFVITPLISVICLFQFCTEKETNVTPNTDALTTAFGTNINLTQLENYESQTKPAYILKDNTGNNPINNKKATLGRVLFYDKNLSLDNSISCGNCHLQQFAFGDTAVTSKGVVGGVTGRHSMRLINTRFAIESKFFWNERAASLEVQTTMPVQDHAEMGFSGLSGRGNMATLLTRLQSVDYYKTLFQFAYNDVNITEQRIQECLAQFVRSIQSFDSKFDAGRSVVPNNRQDFPNFTPQENLGKTLFINPPQFDATGNRIGGGLGCEGCHQSPEFDIDPNSGNNGSIAVIAGGGIDITNTRAPTLRDLVRTDGTVNGPFMHAAAIKTLQAVLGHYGTINIAPGNNRLDPRLRPNGFGQKLNLNAQEVDAVIAFLKTLSGKDVYENKKWANPFK